MDANAAASKQALRELMLASRQLATAADTAQSFSDQLVELASELKVNRVGCYLSFGSEPATDIAIASLQRIGISIYCPRINSAGEMDFVLVDSSFQKNPLGFLEPTGELVDDGQIELLVVPGLAIDSHGNRLGRGGGFYDRYLTSFSGVSVALVYDSELIDRIATEAHDQKVNFAITESRRLSFLEVN